MASLHELLGIELHVVAQIVKTKFVIGSVGDIGVIGFLALFIGQTGNNHATGQAKEVIQLSHPSRVTLGQIVVDRNDMHALAFKGIEHNRQCGNKCLTFTGLHFGNLALVQSHGSKELHIIMSHAKDTTTCLPHQRKNLRQYIIESLFSRLDLITIYGNLLRKVFICKFLHLRLKRIDFHNQRTQLSQKSIILAANNLAYQKTYHGYSGQNGRNYGCNRVSIHKS